MAAAGAEKPAAAAAEVPGQQQEEKEKEALFAAKHAELVSEARDVAREHGVAVTTVAFRPDGTAVADEAVGVGLQEQVRAMIQRAIARKVSLMESGELAAHRRELQMLRGIVVGELTQARVVPGQKKETDGEVVVAKTTLGQQQEMDGDAGAAGAGCNKIIGRVD
jgi:hypothetical protein